MEIKIFSPSAVRSFALYETLAKLIRDSFIERSQSGLNFSCANFSTEEYMSHTLKSYLIVAFDNGKIVGTETLTPYENKGMKCGLCEFLAVSPSYKGNGLASKMFLDLLNLAIDLNMDYLSSSTAEQATSSVKYHKKNGFLVVWYDSYGDTNYYSYHFIYPIKKLNFLKNPIIRNTLFICSYLKCKITKDKNGLSRFKKKIIV